jgi:GDP-L-fucose synthase
MEDFYADRLVLVAGGTGFIGSHIVDKLLERGAKVRIPIHMRKLDNNDPNIEILTADLTTQEDCLRAVEGVDYVFHAAGAVGSAAVKGNKVMQTMTINLILTAQILQAACASDVKRFLLFSSTTGYPAVDYPVKEDEMWNGPVFPGYFGYGWMKRYIEKLGEFVYGQSAMKVAIIRPTAIYGSRDNFDPASCHVIPALIRRAIEKGNPYVVWGSGEVIRDFLHVKDLARACLLMVEKHADCDPINIGSGQAITIKEVVKQILRAVGYENVRVVYDTSKPTALPIRIVDTKKARSVIGFEPEIMLEEGIRETVEWYKSNLL